MKILLEFTFQVYTGTLTMPFIHYIISTIYLISKVKDIDIIYYVAPDGALAGLLSKFVKKIVIVNTDGIE